jgi:hypothetical protein
MIQGEIIDYWQNKEALPSSLDNLKNDISGFIPPRDPETGTAYEYAILEPLKFKLCATFKYPSPYKADQNRATPVMAPYYYGLTNEVWNHEAGLKCFERTIDPELYPKSVR